MDSHDSSMVFWWTGKSKFELCNQMTFGDCCQNPCSSSTCINIGNCKDVINGHVDVLGSIVLSWLSCCRAFLLSQFSWIASVFASSSLWARHASSILLRLVCIDTPLGVCPFSAMKALLNTIIVFFLIHKCPQRKDSDLWNNIFHEPWHCSVPFPCRAWCPFQHWSSVFGWVVIFAGSDSQHGTQKGQSQKHQRI